MDNLRIGDKPVPSVTVKLPALSPPFISADDAARFAHEAIGNQRDKEYGGAILQHEGGRFFATLPIAGDMGLFDHQTMMSTDVRGNFVHPDGFKCYAFYHSHPAHYAQMKAANPAFSDDQIEAALSFYSEADKYFMIHHRDFVPAHYLSGAANCLLKYVTRRADAETQVGEQIRVGRPADLFAHFEGPIHELARVGTLSVVVANKVWGGRRGQIDQQWALNTPATRTSIEQPFCTQVFDQLAKAVEAVTDVDGAKPDRRSMGFVLKVAGQDEYFATEPVTTLTPLFSPDELFPSRDNGGPKLPSNCRLDGVYYISQPVVAQRPVKETWLYENFFSPAELAAVIAQSRKDTYLQDSQRGLTVYMRAKGAALLSYKCSGSSAETALATAHGSTAQNQLKAGTLSPFDFVVKVAAAGQLTVLQNGEVWDTVGVVGQGWRPFERIHQSLSPAFLSADDAARYAHNQIGDKRDVEHFGFVLQRADGKYFATTPIAEKDWKKDWGLPFGGGISSTSIDLPGYRYEATYAAPMKSRAKIKKAQPTWSDERIELFMRVPDFPYLVEITSGSESISTHYYSGASDSLVRYVCSRSQEERNFGALLDNALKSGGRIGIQLDGFDGSVEQLVKKLVRIGELSVVISNPGWRGSRGKVPSTWVEYEPFFAASPVDPVLSRIFPDPLTAAQFAHDQMLAKSTFKQIAFILKSLQTEEYVVTDPVIIDPAQTSLPLFSPLQAFSVDAAGKPKLPEGYAIQSVCYLSLPDTRSSLKEKWIYECFVSPTDLSLAIGNSRVAKPSGFALYVSTRDGAQLKYVFSQTTQENQLYAVTPHGIVTDNGDQAELATGALTPLEFVKRVAAAGVLSVVQTGRLWDVQGVVGQNWQPFALYPKPDLSPAFLTADDAARYAHERIGNWRDYGFSGYILQRQDQRFVVTEPLDNYTSGRFSLGHIYPADATGKAILPEHHVLHAVYASCQAFSRYELSRMQRFSWSREQAFVDAQMFSDVDIHTIIQHRHSVSLAYLSSAEDALIAYDTSGSAAERALLKQVAPGPNGSLMAQNLASGALKPEDIVKQLADAGGLRVVVGSGLWGASGMVPDYWKAFPAAKEHEVPEQVAFGAIFSSADAAAKDAHERVRRYAPDQTCFAFILKHEREDQYIVSETVAANARQPLFSLASLFRTNASGDVEYPKGFNLFGLFYARHWMPKTLGSTETWLAQHFISSNDLYQAFFEARRLRAEGRDVGLSVYISTLDLTLLLYQTPGATTLFNTVIQPSGVSEDVHAQLASGQLRPEDFVTKVATLSWLKVVVPSEFWGEQNLPRLAADWKPYSQYARRHLSPAFTCQADAVRYAYRLLGARRDNVYGGLVLKCADGLFVVTEPMVVPTENFDPKWILPDEHVAPNLLAPGCKVVARYRTRAATEFAFHLAGLEKQVYLNFLSTEVLCTALASDHLWTHEYLFGPDGSLVSFTLHDEDHDLLVASQKDQLAARVALLESQLAASRDSPYDPWSNLIERRIRNGSGTPTEFVDQLVKAGALHVLESSNLWGPVRKVTTGWQPQQFGFLAPESVRFATADRELSPAFCDADDAVRYAHEHAGDREQWVFGFILKSSRNAHSVASLPVLGDDLKFAFERVFLRGQLPAGYAVQGLYLCAPARQPDGLPRDEVYRSFIPPSVLRTALAAVEVINAGATRRFQPLYLSCADGALLKYEALNWDSDFQNHSKLTAYVETLQGDGSSAAYIRKVAHSGNLSVLVSSQTWTAMGRVGQTWKPRDLPAHGRSDEQRLALGPLCSHPDDAARLEWRSLGAFHNKAYLGAILRKGGGTAYVAVKPLDDNGPTVPVGLRGDTPAYRRLFGGVMNLGYTSVSDKYPAGFTVVGVQQFYKVDSTPGSFSSPYEETLYRNFIAHDEIRAFIEMLTQDEVPDARYYWVPRHGALLLYAPSYREDEGRALLDDWSDDVNGVIRSKLNDVLGTLATSGRFYILKPDVFWRPTGQVSLRLLLEMSRRGPDSGRRL